MVRALLVTGLVALGAALAGCAEYPPPPPPGFYGPPPPGPYAAHVRRCFARHANYDPRSNTFIGWDGYPHVCRA